MQENDWFFEKFSKSETKTKTRRVWLFVIFALLLTACLCYGTVQAFNEHIRPNNLSILHLLE